MKKALLIFSFFSFKLAAFPPNPPPPRLYPADYQLLMNLEYHGRSGIVWQDGKGHTHIISMPCYLTFCSMVTGIYTFYSYCDGAPVVFVKDPTEQIYLNGIKVNIYPLDYTGQHLYLLPS